MAAAVLFLWGLALYAVCLVSCSSFESRDFNLDSICALAAVVVVVVVVVSVFSLGVGLGQLLQQGVGLAVGGLDAVGPHDAGGPVQVEHHHELLALHAQLLDLGLQVRVHHLQTLRLLGRGAEDTKP